MSESNLVYLSLGSNLGDRAANLERAIAALPEAGIQVLRRSSIYETEPVDFLAQPWFLNSVVETKTSLPPREVLNGLQEIERRMGSKKLIARGPRIIDLDILFYDNCVVREEGMEIPHPRMADRRFVLVPLAELIATLEHPVLHVLVERLLAKTQDRSVVRAWLPPLNNDANEK